jgi:hypothetical protein
MKLVQPACIAPAILAGIVAAVAAGALTTDTAIACCHGAVPKPAVPHVHTRPPSVNVPRPDVSGGTRGAIRDAVDSATRGGRGGNRTGGNRGTNSGPDDYVSVGDKAGLGMTDPCGGCDPEHPDAAQQILINWSNAFEHNIKNSYQPNSPGTVFSLCKIALQCALGGAPSPVDIIMAPLPSNDSSAFEAHLPGAMFRPLDPNNPLSAPVDKTVQGLVITNIPGWPGGPVPLPGQAQQPPAPTPTPTPPPAQAESPPPAQGTATIVNPWNPFSSPGWPTSGPAAVK